MSSIPLSADSSSIGGREYRERDDRPGLAAVRLQRQPGRDRAVGVVGGGRGRPHVHQLVHRQRRQRRGLDHVGGRATGIAQRRDRLIGGAPGRRRRVARSQQGDIELRPGRLANREAVLRGGQDRGGVRGPAGEEQDAAELDRRGRDRPVVIPRSTISDSGTTASGARHAPAPARARALPRAGHRQWAAPPAHGRAAPPRRRHRRAPARPPPRRRNRVTAS